jgi:hypothetical protein
MPRLLPRSARSARARARGGSGDLTLLLPALVTFAAAVLVARLLRPALRVIGRLARGRSPHLGLRLAFALACRNPGYAVVATAFSSSGFGLASLARLPGDLDAQRADQAHRVPLDYLVREDLRRLIPVQDAASFQRFGEVPGVDVSPVLRLTGGIGRLEGESGITLLGIPPSALAQLNGWRDSDADASRSELARRIDVPSTLAGVRLSKELTYSAGGRWVGTSRLRRDRGPDGRLPSSLDEIQRARRQVGGDRARGPRAVAGPWSGPARL